MSRAGQRLALSVSEYEAELAGLHGPIAKFDDAEFVEVSGHLWKRWLRWAQLALNESPAVAMAVRVRRRRGGSR